MKPHRCPDAERGDYCGICERAISAAEDERDFPGRDDMAADHESGRHERTVLGL